MKICVYGLWHLGSVTAACLAQLGHEVVAIDPDLSRVQLCKEGTMPLFEPGLSELSTEGVRAGRLNYTADLSAVKDAEVVWVTFDTPVDDDDRADIDFVNDRVKDLFPYLRDGTVVLVSSQMPVGSVAALEVQFAKNCSGRAVHFACSPENLRLGKALEIFRNPGRIVIGIRDPRARQILEPFLAQICSNLLWISVESAEMTKHAINAFLATCVVFANEVATICEQVGANAADVERAIRSDPRVGTKTYVTPGAAFAGGTLARDVTFLTEIGSGKQLQLQMLNGIVPSNAVHRTWALRRVRDVLSGLLGRRIAVWGLSYKPGTDAIRRSVSVELCRGFLNEGASVAAFDPVVKALPVQLKEVSLANTALDAVREADALVVATEWPEFRQIRAEDILSRMRNPLIVDPARFLSQQFTDARAAYATIGASL